MNAESFGSGNDLSNQRVSVVTKSIAIVSLKANECRFSCRDSFSFLPPRQSHISGVKAGSIQLSAPNSDQFMSLALSEL